MAAGTSTSSSSGSFLRGEYLLVLAAMMMLVDLFLIFTYAPTAIEALGTQAQRLFYFHVPAVLTGFISFAVSAVASLVYLLRRSKRWDRIAYASAESGVIFFSVGILLGAIWAKPVWQTWWVWDANGTLTFVLWLMFIGYLVARSYAPTTERGARWGAVVGVVGAVAVPFVYMAADWWDGLHTERVTGPGAQGSLESEMFYTFMYSFLSFLVLYASLVWLRASQRGQEEALEELRRTASR